MPTVVAAVADVIADWLIEELAVSGVTAIVASYVITFAVIGALAGKVLSQRTPQTSTPSFPDRTAGRQVMARSNIASMNVVYGEIMLSGPLVFAATSGTSNELLHLVVVLAAHEVESIGDVYFDDKVSTDYDASFFTIYKHLGKENQTVDTVLQNAVPAWDGAHRLQGCAYLYVRLKFSQNVWPNGLPNVKAIVRGKKLWDPRTTPIPISTSSYLTGANVQVNFTAPHGRSVGDKIFIYNHSSQGQVFGQYEVLTIVSSTAITIAQNEITPVAGTGGSAYVMAYSLNPTLAKLDYITSPHGLNAGSSEIDLVSFIAAANSCEESVALQPTPTTFSLDTSTGVFTRGDRTGDICTGSIINLATTGTLPGNYTPGNYYAIDLTGGGVQIATTYANAIRGMYLAPPDPTQVGSGTQTMTRVSQPRYLLNGMVDLTSKPLDVMQNLNTADVGAVTFSQGTYKVFSGVATIPVALALTADDLSGDLTIEKGPQRRDIYNAVRGVFADPNSSWQPSDFPPVTNKLYESQDGYQIFTDLQLPFTTNSTMAQRIAKIHLEKSRQGITLNMPCKLTALRFIPWDVVPVTIAELGFSAKPFRIVDWKLTQQQGAVGVMLSLQEESAASYEWNMGLETTVDPAPDTALPDLFTCLPPTGLTLYSGTGELYVNNDGTVVQRIHAVWTASADIFVDHYEVQAQNLTTGEVMATVSIQTGTDMYISPVQVGDLYSVRVRSVNIRGVNSTFDTVFNYSVVGKTTAPSDVTGFTATQQTNIVVLKWNQVSDLDVAGYEIRYASQVNAMWSVATPLTSVTRGTGLTTAAIPPGTWTMLIKAVDTSGNYSVNAESANVTVSNSNTVIKGGDNAPDFVGTLTNFIRHPSGVLVPDDQNVASFYDGLSGQYVFDHFVPTPYTTCSYQPNEADLGFDYTVRAWASVAAVVGPGQPGTDVLTVTEQFDYHTSTGAYAGFQAWSTGQITGEFFKFKMIMDTTTGVGYVSSFNTSLDSAGHTVSGSTAVAVGGTLITFSQRFASAPTNIQVTAQGTSALTAVYSAVSATQMTLQVFNNSGADVGGTVSWSVTGP